MPRANVRQLLKKLVIAVKGKRSQYVHPDNAKMLD
jgi:hypothetical protein